MFTMTLKTKRDTKRSVTQVKICLLHDSGHRPRQFPNALTEKETFATLMLMQDQQRICRPYLRTALPLRGKMISVVSLIVVGQQDVAVCPKNADRPTYNGKLQMHAKNNTR
jgi:hypothetical protein